jgi:hypothetical protein
MAVLEVSSITQSKAETVMFFGQVMSDLADEAYQESKAQLEGEEFIN